MIRRRRRNSKGTADIWTQPNFDFMSMSIYLILSYLTNSDNYAPPPFNPKLDLQFC